MRSMGTTKRSYLRPQGWSDRASARKGNRLARRLCYLWAPQSPFTIAKHPARQRLPFANFLGWRCATARGSTTSSNNHGPAYFGSIVHWKKLETVYSPKIKNNFQRNQHIWYGYHTWLTSVTVRKKLWSCFHTHMLCPTKKLLARHGARMGEMELGSYFAPTLKPATVLH